MILMSSKIELPLAPVKRILSNANAERVSDDAVKALADVLIEYGASVADKAVKVCKHAGRKTINAGDINISA